MRWEAPRSRGRGVGFAASGTWVRILAPYSAAVTGMMLPSETSVRIGEKGARQPYCPQTRRPPRPRLLSPPHSLTAVTQSRNSSGPEPQRPQRSQPHILRADSLITVSVWKDPENPATDGR